LKVIKSLKEDIYHNRLKDHQNTKKEEITNIVLDRNNQYNSNKGGKINEDSKDGCC